MPPTNKHTQSNVMYTYREFLLLTSTTYPWSPWLYVQAKALHSIKLWFTHHQKCSYRLPSPSYSCSKYMKVLPSQSLMIEITWNSTHVINHLTDFFWWVRQLIHYPRVCIGLFWRPWHTLTWPYHTRLVSQIPYLSKCANSSIVH